MKHKILLATFILLLSFSLGFSSFNANIVSATGGNFTETDTFQTVTDRGATTTNDINVQGNIEAETIGIGTASPDFLLEVVGGGDSIYLDAPTGSIGALGRSDIKLQTNSQNIFRGLDHWTNTWQNGRITTYFQTGRFGGNTAFSSLNGAPYFSLAFISRSNSGRGILFTDSGGQNAALSNYITVRQDIGSRTDFVISYNGDVGIGTESPAYELDVIGDGRFNGTVRATDFITTSRVANFSSDYRSIDQLNNVDEWRKADNSLDYDKHYAFINDTEKIKKGYNEVLVPIEICDKHKRCIIEYEMIQEPIYEDVEIKGLSMETRVAEMEKMIWELHQETKRLQSEINTLKGVRT